MTLVSDSIGFYQPSCGTYETQVMPRLPLGSVPNPVTLSPAPVRQHADADVHAAGGRALIDQGGWHLVTHPASVHGVVDVASPRRITFETPLQASSDGVLRALNFQRM